MFTKIISFILSFIMGFFTYPLSFLECEKDTSFYVTAGGFFTFNGEYKETNIYGENYDDGTLVLNDKVTIEFNDTMTDWFNYFALSYTSDSYVKGELEYKAGVVVKTEEFFLEKSEEFTTFRSFIDNALNGTKANGIYSVSFYPLEKSGAKINIGGMATFNRDIPESVLYIESEGVKIGVDLLWGGALSYLEDTDSAVEAVDVDGRVYVDSNASERYGKKAFNKNVNLINRCDTGRLVQQSYYGTGNCDRYQGGEFMGQTWNYNPVQGGNQFNESSKIVDFTVDESSIYIKCRPLDWAKEKEYITPSYMEAWYSIENKTVHVECRFVDYSGYPVVTTSQEIPAFYCIEPLNNFVYCKDGVIANEPELIFWPDAGYPKFFSNENWAAFTGPEKDSFGIGLYVPGETEFLAGVYDRGGELAEDISVSGPTSYIAVIQYRESLSFVPFEYDYYLATGTTEEIRASFNAL